jgi:hypothetical protein
MQDMKKKSIPLGSIMCPLCDELIDTFESEKVIIYYSKCNKHACGKKDGEENDC